MKYVIDLDGTICVEKEKGTPFTEYANVEPKPDVINKINELHDNGHEIIISTARHMLSTNGDVGTIMMRIGEITLSWLRKNNVKYDKIYFQKPYGDFYVDDKSMSINAFLDEEV